MKAVDKVGDSLVKVGRAIFRRLHSEAESLDTVGHSRAAVNCISQLLFCSDI